MRMAGRSMGLKAVILICSLITVVIVIHTMSSNLSSVAESSETSPQHFRSNRTKYYKVQKPASNGKDGPVSVCKAKDIHTVFTDMEYSFVMMLDYLKKPMNTEMFLDCCIDLTKVFDRIGATAFAPVKANFNKQIRLVTEKFDKDRSKYSTLESIIQEEAKAGIQTSSSSVSDSIVWLGRSILFLSELFNRLKEDKKFHVMVTEAYTMTIKQYHNFFIRSLFSMVSSAVATKETVVASLGSSESDARKPDYPKCLMESIETYNKAIVKVCAQLRTLLKKYDLVLLHKVKS